VQFSSQRQISGPPAKRVKLTAPAICMYLSPNWHPSLPLKSTSLTQSPTSTRVESNRLLVRDVMCKPYVRDEASIERGRVSPNVLRGWSGKESQGETVPFDAWQTVEGQWFGTHCSENGTTFCIKSYVCSCDLDLHVLCDHHGFITGSTQRDHQLLTAITATRDQQCLASKLALTVTASHCDDRSRSRLHST
jgi:hypothetical protein